MKTDIMNFVADELSAYENIDFKLILAENHETTIVLHNGQTEQLQQATATSLALNLLIDGRDGFYYTNNLDQQELKIFIRLVAPAVSHDALYLVKERSECLLYALLS